MNRVVLACIIVGLATANLALAPNTLAHGSGHYNRYGTSITISYYNTALAGYSYPAQLAISEWSDKTILYVPSAYPNYDVWVASHYSSGGFCGLAENRTPPDQYGHGTGHHVWFNERCTGWTAQDIQAIYCQELGHAWGLDHSADGCMGFQYYGNLRGVVTHNINDIYNKYRYSHPH